MKIKYTVKKKLDFEDAQDGFFLIILNGTGGSASTVFELKNPFVRIDGALMWNEGKCRWFKHFRDYTILNKEEGGIFLKKT